MKHNLQPPLIGAGLLLLAMPIFFKSLAQQKLEVSYHPISEEMVLLYEPLGPESHEIRIERSFDLHAWEPVAWRFDGETDWQTSAGVSISEDQITGEITATFPKTDKTNVFARVIAFDENGNVVIDSDFDGISDWLENYIDTLPINQDTDTDGVSDRMEILSGSDPTINDWITRESSEQDLATGLQVYTPTQY